VVTVTEGTVIVAPEVQPDRPVQRDSGETARLEAGQKLIYDNQAVMPVSVANTDDAVAWRSGLLKYRGEKLRFVVEDVQRYIDYPIILADTAVGEIQYTGTVFQDSADTWVYGLEDAFSIVVSDSASGIVLGTNVDGNQPN
jgi:ferric-dicitrate binding protein FerR (iron transport regulator)